MRRTQRLLLVLIPAALLVAAVAVAFFSAQRTLRRAGREVRISSQLPFKLEALDPSAGPQNSGFEPVASANAFTCGAFFADDLYLAGSGGLSIYASDGTLRRILRTGLELPVAPIVGIAQGRLRGAAEPQLLLATAGAGLLLFEPHATAAPTIRQLLPTTPDTRDLTSVLPLLSGDVLLGTRRSGVFLFSGASLSPVRFTLTGTDPNHLEVTALAAVDAVSYLIGTHNAGIFYLHGGTVEHADTNSGLPDNQVDAIVVAAGKAFAGTPLGIAQFDLSQAGLRPVRTLAAGLFSHALAVDPAASTLTVGSLDQGIQQIDLDARPRFRDASIAILTPDESAERVDQFLTQPNPSAPLYAIRNGALAVREASGWVPALPRSAIVQTLTDRNISALAFDPEGRLYVGFFDRGLDILSAQPLTPIRHLEDDHLFCINRLVVDPLRHTIAAATANGLVLFDEQGAPRQILTRRDGLISDHVSDIAFTRAGSGFNTVVATPAGLTFLTPTGADSLYAFQGLINNHVYALAASPQSDRLLAGTLGGLSQFYAEAVSRNFTTTNSGLKHNWITAIATLPDGSDLIGTYGAGIERLTTDKDSASRFVPIDLPAGTPRDLVINPNAIYVTPTHIYAGTLGHGMLVYGIASGRWSAVTRGLPSLNVTAFAVRNGELYVGTENGLVRIPEAALGASFQ